MAIIVECNNKKYTASQWVEALMTGEVMDTDKYIMGEVTDNEN